MINGKRIKRVIYIYDDDTQDSVDIPVYPREQAPKWPEISPYKDNGKWPEISPYKDNGKWPEISPYNTCYKCGLDLSGPMGYYCCPNGNCPSGLGGSFCKSS